MSNGPGTPLRSGAVEFSGPSRKEFRAEARSGVPRPASERLGPRRRGAGRRDLSAGPSKSLKLWMERDGAEPCAGAQCSIPEAVLRASAILRVLRVLRVKLRRRDA